MTRLGTRSTLLAVAANSWGDSFQDFTDDVSKAVIVTVEAAQRLFGRPDYEHGGMRDYRLSLTLAQDSAATSLWGFAWENATYLVRFHLAPHGNVAASETEPHWTGEAWVSGPDGDLLGGEADKSRNAVNVSEMAWVIVGVPDRVTSGTYPTDPPEGW